MFAFLLLTPAQIAETNRARSASKGLERAGEVILLLGIGFDRWDLPHERSSSGAVAPPNHENAIRLLDRFLHGRTSLLTFSPWVGADQGFFNILGKRGRG
jgi:hypothetical protein